MKKSFLEQVGILFATSVYIEWIIKDLIIFKKFPEFIDEINSGVISEGLIEKRIEAFKGSFNQDVVNEFCTLYKLDESETKLYTIIWLLRDIFWHSRVWIEDWTIWHCPQRPNKLKKIKELFWIEWEGNTITITEEKLNFDLRIKIIEELDNIQLPKLAKSIWLDYARLR